MDESATINPAALNAPTSTIAPNLLAQPSPRGTKRSRSPDSHGGAQGQEPEHAQAAKRSRPGRPGDSAGAMPLTISQQPVQTPQIKAQPLPQTSPLQSSPHRSTPGSATKTPVVKALPTVRDHTTDQLGPDGDEYIPRETDPDGETKVSKDGYLQDGRKYRCRTFHVPNRGEKLFMLATECARVLGYRDSYLLFNKNRSLYKIIANQQEKDNLIHQEILPYSYRSRQIAIVTARSMFRQFGARLVEGGRRVRDDYWEAKARKQGFTEEDLAGEKRPGAAKAREAAAAEARQNPLASLPHSEIIYSNGPSVDGQPPGYNQVSLAPLPMIHLPSDELRPSSSYGNIVRPRQEPGPPYQDRTQSSNPQEILNQAAQAAEYNKQLSQTRTHRANYLDDYWRRPHEQPSTQAEQSSGDIGAVGPQHLQSPQATVGVNQGRGQQDHLSHPVSQVIPTAYSGYPNQQNPMASPAPQIHRVMPQQMPTHGTPMGMASAAPHRQTPSYGYGTGQMWQPPPTQPSPLSQSHQLQYGQQQPQPQPQPQHQHHSPMPPPQMPQQGSMSYGQMNQMATPTYAMNRNLYQPSPNPQQFNMGSVSTAAHQAGMQGWTTQGTMPQDWQRFQ